MSKFPFLWNNFQKCIREREEKMEKTAHLIVKKFQFLWNNYQKFIKEIEEEYRKNFSIFRKSIVRNLNGRNSEKSKKITVFLMGTISHNLENLWNVFTFLINFLTVQKLIRKLGQFSSNLWNTSTFCRKFYAS